MTKHIIRVFTLNLLAVFSIAFFSSCDKDNDISAVNDVEINLSEEEITLEIGKSRRITAGFVPSDAPNKAHTWTSQNTKIATVDETGNITGVSVGTTRITATALANKKTATCVVNVVDKVVPVSSITLNTKEETVYVGATVALQATVLPTTATEKIIKWTSNNPSVATVDNNGLVKTLAEGNANITATVGGKSAVCAISVVPKGVDFSKISYTSQVDGSVLISGAINPQGLTLTEIGFCMSTETTPTINTNRHVLPLILNVNTEIGNLTPNTTYYIRIYAIADDEVYFGKTAAVKTPEPLVTDFKLEYSKFNEYTNEYSMKISTPFNPDYSLSLCYGESPDPEITDNIVSGSSSGNKMSFNLNKLTGAKTYYVRAYSLKNGKPIYYPGGASFSTLGKDTKLKPNFLSGSRKADIWEYSIDYTLPEKGDYSVVVKQGVYPLKIGKTSNDVTKTSLYIKAGTGKIYANLDPWNSYEKYNGAGTIVFRNMDSGTEYFLTIGAQN